MFEVNSKMSRATSATKVALNQTIQFAFDDTPITFTQTIANFTIPPFQPYYYGRRPLSFKIPDGLTPTHESSLFKNSYTFTISCDIMSETGGSTQIRANIEEVILAPPTLYNTSSYLPLITYDFIPPSENILRPFWQDDKSADICSVCGTTFNFITRKHHCRFVTCRRSNIN